MVPAAGGGGHLGCQETVKPWSLAYLTEASCQACSPATASVLSANALPSVSLKFDVDVVHERQPLEVGVTVSEISVNLVDLLAAVEPDFLVDELRVLQNRRSTAGTRTVRSASFSADSCRC